MKNIKILQLEKYADVSRYQFVEESIYKDMVDDEDEPEFVYRIAFSYELEAGEGQYPLEDILDEYTLYVSDFLDSEDAQQPGDIVSLELGGDLEDIRKIRELAGKRVFNEDYTAEDGQVYTRLVVE